MKRKTRDNTGSDDVIDEAVSKKQIIEHEVVDEASHEAAPEPKKSTSRKKKTSVDDEAIPVKPAKTPAKSKTSKKLPATTPKKKPERNGVMHNSAPIVAATSDVKYEGVLKSPTSSVVNSTGATVPVKAVNLKEKPNEAESALKKTVARNINPPQQDSTDLLNILDMVLFSVSWFVFGILAVWCVLSVLHPPAASTLQGRVFDMFDVVSSSKSNFYVVEGTYFFLTLLGFHFVLSFIVGVVDEPK